MNVNIPLCLSVTLASKDINLKKDSKLKLNSEILVKASKMVAREMKVKALNVQSVLTKRKVIFKISENHCYA